MWDACASRWRLCDARKHSIARLRIYYCTGNRVGSRRGVVPIADGVRGWRVGYGNVQRSTSEGFAPATAGAAFRDYTLITLGVGVGANTVIFSVLEGVLLKPLPYPHPEQLIGVWHTAPGVGISNLNMSPSNYFIDREQNTTFQDIGVYDSDSLSVTGAGEPEQVRGLDVYGWDLADAGSEAGAGPTVYAGR